MKVGDRVVVINRNSSFIYMKGVLDEYNPITPDGQSTQLAYLVRLEGFDGVDNGRVPFMRNEIMAVPPSGEAGPSDGVASNVGGAK